MPSCAPGPRCWPPARRSTSRAAARMAMTMTPLGRPLAPGMPADGPRTNSVVARWEGGWRCRVAAGGFDLLVDEPESAGGTGTGPMPTEYLLAAMASCYALAWAAGKRGATLPGLTVTATGTYDGPRFSELRLTVASDAPPDLVGKLL